MARLPPGVQGMFQQGPVVHQQMSGPVGPVRHPGYLLPEMTLPMQQMNWPQMMESSPGNMGQLRTRNNVHFQGAQQRYQRF